MKAKTKNDYTWQALPIVLMKHFDDSQEWSLMQLIWFRSNFPGHKLNLAELNECSCIKTRGVLMSVLQRVVAKDWVKKTAVGTSGKHHKYSLNKAVFIEWIKSKMETVSESDHSENKMVSKPDRLVPQNGQQIRPDLVGKSDSIDNSLDNFLKVEKSNPLEKEKTSGFKEQLPCRAVAPNINGEYQLTPDIIEELKSKGLTDTQINYYAVKARSELKQEVKQSKQVRTGFDSIG